MIGPLRLVPNLRARIWGGSRLASLAVGAGSHGQSPGATESESVPGMSPAPIGEAWTVGEANTVAAGPNAGRTVAELASTFGQALLGPDGMAQAAGRFPILVKFLDAHDWLSIQVHPDDELAARLEGPGHLGKTEAWYVVAASPGAELIVGVRPGIDPERVRAAVRDGTLPELLASVGVRAGDVVLVRAGTLHAVGPGLLLYEIQQSSDITYRVSDWGRPAAAGRALHVDRSLQALDPRGRAAPRSTSLEADDRLTAIACEKFVADIVAVQAEPALLDTARRSFHAVTVVSGGIAVVGDGWVEPLAPFESLLIPAETGEYEVRPAGGSARAIVAHVP